MLNWGAGDVPIDITNIYIHFKLSTCKHNIKEKMSI